jgi:hypothetical protein
MRPASLPHRVFAVLSIFCFSLVVVLAAGLFAGAATAGQFEGQCKQSGGTNYCIQEAVLDPWSCWFNSQYRFSNSSFEACAQAVLDWMNAQAAPGYSYVPSSQNWCSKPRLTGYPRNGDNSLSYYVSSCSAARL